MVGSGRWRSCRGRRSGQPWPCHPVDGGRSSSPSRRSRSSRCPGHTSIRNGSRPCSGTSRSRRRRWSRSHSSSACRSRSCSSPSSDRGRGARRDARQSEPVLGPTRRGHRSDLPVDPGADHQGPAVPTTRSDATAPSPAPRESVGPAPLWACAARTVSSGRKPPCSNRVPPGPPARPTHAGSLDRGNCATAPRGRARSVRFLFPCIRRSHRPYARRLVHRPITTGRSMAFDGHSVVCERITSISGP